MGRPVKKDDLLEGSLACIQDKKNFRELNVAISYHHMRALNKEKPEYRTELY